MLTEIKMRCFVAVAETLNFSNAGKLLYMSQQAVSKNIAKLENELGYSLLSRGHSISLTPAGRQTYELFSQLLREAKTGIRKIQNEQLAAGNAMTIGIQNFITVTTPVNNALKALHEKNSLIQVNVLRFDPNTLLNRLLIGEVDLAIMNKRFLRELSNLRVEELADTSMAIMISASHPYVTEGGTLEDIAKLPFIVDPLANEPTEDYNRRVNREITSCGLEPASIISVPDRDSAYTAAELGYGIILGSTMSHMAKDRQLKRYPLKHKDSTVAVWINDSRKDNLVLFADLLKIEMQKYMKETAHEPR